MNEILGVFTLDPGLLGRKSKRVIQHTETSSSCEASQQTDTWDLTRLTRCPCTLRETTIPLDESRSCRILTNCEDSERNKGDFISSQFFSNINNPTKNEQKTLKSITSFDKVRRSNVGVTSTHKHLHKSRSESCLTEFLKYESLTTWVVPQSQDTKFKDERQAAPLGISAPGEKHDNNNREDPSRFVFNTLKVKADLKVSSTLGLTASWKEGRGHINNAEQICELLDRLKQAVEADEEGTKVCM